MMPGESDSLHLPLRAILLVPNHYNCVARARLLFSIAVSILCPRNLYWVLVHWPFAVSSIEADQGGPRRRMVNFSNTMLRIGAFTIVANL